MKSPRRLAVVAATFMLIAVGCSSAPAALTPIKLQLQWFPQAQFAGYYAALDQGYYKAEGLDVSILPGGVDIVPATVVAGGNAQFGISWVPKALASRESGADIQFIGQVFQRSGTLQIAWKASNITQPVDWKGKKVGTWGFGNEAELYAAMLKNGIDPTKATDVTIVPQDFTMTAFLNKDIDAAQAMIYNEYAQVLEAKNPATGQLYTAADLDIISMESAGTAMLQDGIFASQAYLKDHSDVAVKFLRASYKGWQFCRDNADKCVTIVLAADAKLPKGHQTWELNEINGLIWPSPNGIGMMDPAAFTRTVQIAIDGKILTKQPDADAYTNTYTTQALKDLGGDTTGATWTKATVTLTEGGN
ncbi:MAG: ABC transporter substrate-binding protein [Candidatus Limnocylindrales bacterium]